MIIKKYKPKNEFETALDQTPEAIRDLDGITSILSKSIQNTNELIVNETRPHPFVEDFFTFNYDFEDSNTDHLQYIEEFKKFLELTISRKVQRINKLQEDIVHYNTQIDEVYEQEKNKHPKYSQLELDDLRDSIAKNIIGIDALLSLQKESSNLDKIIRSLTLCNSELDNLSKIPKTEKDNYISKKQDVLFSIGDTLINNDPNTNYQKIRYKGVPQIKGIEYSLVSIPAFKDVSGDIFYVEKLNEDEIIFAVGDVSGKGVLASIYANKLKDQIKISQHKNSPAEMLDELHNLFSSFNNPMRFASIVYGIYNKKTNSFNYSSAGQSFFIVDKKTKSVNHINTPSYLLGIRDASEEKIKPYKYYSKILNLSNSDRLVLTTDGFFESSDQRGNYAGNNFKENIVTMNLSPAKVMAKLYNKLRSENKNGPKDDTTILIADFD